MGANGTEDAIRALALRRHLPDAHLARWLAMDEPSRAAFFGIAERLRLRTGQLVAALELLGEIALRESCTPAAVLGRPEVRRPIDERGAAPTRASAFLEALRKVRFPRLGRTMARLRAELAELKLPPGISVVLPKDLNSDELVVRLTVRTSAELARLIAALKDKEAGLVRLLKVLDGEDEV